MFDAGLILLFLWIVFSIHLFYLYYLIVDLFLILYSRSFSFQNAMSRYGLFHYRLGI